MNSKDRRKAVITRFELNTAKAECREANERLVKAVKKALPIGATVRVALGGRWIIGVVTSNHTEHWSYYLGYVTIRNIKTGKKRHFCAAGYTEWHVIEYPKRQAAKKK